MSNMLKVVVLVDGEEIHIDSLTKTGLGDAIQQAKWLAEDLQERYDEIVMAEDDEQKQCPACGLHNCICVAVDD